MFATELGRLLKGRASGEDICSRQVINVLTQIDKFIERYPSASSCAAAMFYTCTVDYGRDEAKQSGRGVRFGRVVEPLTRVTEMGFETIDIRREISKLKPVVAKGIELAVQGFSQAEAADEIGVTREYLSRQMKQSEREMQRANKPAA